jgi:MFS family permease
VLTLIFTFNYVDRIALGLVLDDVKESLNLSDAQAGCLSGIAFAFFYSIMGIPIARWADRGNRVTIIGVTTALWSAMVALCGLAGSFLQLLSIRVGVGVGEAGCVPPAQSLIAEYFSRKELPRAFAFYWQGPNLSLIIGYFAAGWINQLYGWRTMFILLGLPGLGVAVLAWLTIMDPRRSISRGLGALSWPKAPLNAAELQTSEVPSISPPSLRVVLVTLWANATFRHLLYAFSVFYFFMYGIGQWQPAFFVRSFGMQTGPLGAWLTVVYGIPALFGMYLGGEWASRYAHRNERLQLMAMAVINGVFNAAIWALIYLSVNERSAFAWMALACLGGNAIIGPMYALPQTLVPANMRATAIALIFLSSNLIGMGFGPLGVGLVSDAFQPIFGRESLRYALLLFTPGYLWISWHLWAASKTVVGDIAATAKLVDLQVNKEVHRHSIVEFAE